MQDSTISIFGSAQAQPGSPAYDEAKRAGRLLAQAGFIVCSGGYGGVMEAASLGAKEMGGSTIGVTTDHFVRFAANPWVDREIRTATFMERLQKLIDVGDGYLALKGGIGTLTEISVVWSLQQTRSIDPRPFVLLADPWEALLDFCSEQLIIRTTDFRHLQLSSSPEDAVAALVEGMAQGGAR